MVKATIDFVVADDHEQQKKDGVQLYKLSSFLSISLVNLVFICTSHANQFKKMSKCCILMILDVYVNVIYIEEIDERERERKSYMSRK